MIQRGLQQSGFVMLWGSFCEVRVGDQFSLAGQLIGSLAGIALEMLVLYYVSGVFRGSHPMDTI
jgi:hypothetical protein